MRRRIVVSMVVGLLVWLVFLFGFCDAATCKADGRGVLLVVASALVWMLVSCVLMVGLPKICLYLFRLPEVVLCFPYFLLTAFLFTQSYVNIAGSRSELVLIAALALPAIAVTIAMQLADFAGGEAFKAALIGVAMLWFFGISMLLFVPQAVSLLTELGMYSVSAAFGWYLLTAFKHRVLSAS